MKYYNDNSEAFIARTLHIDMEEFYATFCQHLSPGSTILDIGCGSGRDLKYFRNMGYKPIGLEPSAKLARFARQHANCEILETTIQDFEPQSQFDGVWASASLLHLSPDELTNALEKISTLMHEDSVFYCSFKYGDEEIMREGRYYNDLTLESFSMLKPDTLEIISSRTTEQVRPDHIQKWLNLYLSLSE